MSLKYILLAITFFFIVSSGYAKKPSKPLPRPLKLTPAFPRSGDLVKVQIPTVPTETNSVYWYFPQLQSTSPPLVYQTKSPQQEALLIVPPGITELDIRWKMNQDDPWQRQLRAIQTTPSISSSNSPWCAPHGIGIGYGAGDGALDIAGDYPSNKSFSEDTKYFTHGHLELAWVNDTQPAPDGNSGQSLLDYRWKKSLGQITQNNLYSKINHLVWENSATHLPLNVIALLTEAFGSKNNSTEPKCIYDVNPSPVINSSVREEYKRETQAWLRRLLRMTKDTVNLYSIFNESPVTHCGRQLFGGYLNFMTEVIMPIVREEVPDAILYHNMFSVENFLDPISFENSTRPNASTGGELLPYYKNYLDEIEKERPDFVQQIGMQGHFSEGKFNLSRIRDTMDQLSEYKKPLLVTEFDQLFMTKCTFGINSSQDCENDTEVQQEQTEEQEESQLGNYQKFMENFLQDKRVQGITIFWLWDPTWRPGGGIFHSRKYGFSPKKGTQEFLSWLGKYHSLNQNYCEGTPGNGFFSGHGPFSRKNKFDPNHPSDAVLNTQEDSIVYAFNSIYDTDYALVVNAKNDRPGPTTYTMEIKTGSNNWRPYADLTFDRNDDSFSAQTGPTIRLKKGAHLFRIKLKEDRLNCAPDAYDESCDRNGYIRNVKLLTNIRVNSATGQPHPYISYDKISVPIGGGFGFITYEGRVYQEGTQTSHQMDLRRKSARGR